MKYFLKIVLFTALATLISGCSSTLNDPFKAYRQQSAAVIFHNAHQALVSKHYSQAVSGYEALDAIYPFGPFSRTAQLESIYAYYMSGDYAQATAAASRFVQLYPLGQGADYAYYMAGVMGQAQGYTFFQRKIGVNPSWRDLSDQKNAFLSFDTVVRRFPKSPYAPDALRRMYYIRNIVADHYLKLANFYYGQKAYVAAANRAGFVVMHLNGTLATPEALALMVKAYRRLQLTQLADQSLQILQNSYPHASALKQLK